MKKKPYHLVAAAFVSSAYLFFGTSCTEEEHHDHDGHDHGEHEHHEGDGHDHSSDEHAHEEGEHKHDHDGHDHSDIEAGPNGGRVLHAVEPHLEFLVTDDRKVQIAALTEEGKVQPIGEQAVTVIGGDRSNPTMMKLTKRGDVLVSEIAFPEGNDFPVVIQIKNSPDAKAETEKFNLNLADCPTCDYKEYACTCDHAH